MGLDPSLSDGRAHAAGLYATPLSEPQASEGSLPWALCASNTEIRQLLGARTLEGHDTQGLVPKVQRPVLRVWGTSCALGPPHVWQQEAMAGVDKEAEVAAETNPRGTQF